MFLIEKIFYDLPWTNIFALQMSVMRSWYLLIKRVIGFEVLWVTVSHDLKEQYLQKCNGSHYLPTHVTTIHLKMKTVIYLLSALFWVNEIPLYHLKGDSEESLLLFFILWQFHSGQGLRRMEKQYETPYYESILHMC